MTQRHRKAPSPPAAPSTPEQIEAVERAQLAADEKQAWAEMRYLVGVLENFLASIKGESLREGDLLPERAARQIVNEIQNMHRNLPLPALLSIIVDVAASRARLEKYGDAQPDPSGAIY